MSVPTESNPSVLPNVRLIEQAIRTLKQSVEAHIEYESRLKRMCSIWQENWFSQCDQLRNRIELLEMRSTAIAEQFRPEIIEIIAEGRKRNSIAALEELIQLTPPGLFDMMRIKGLGGHKLHVLWQTAKIDTVEGLLAAAKAGLIEVQLFPRR